MDKLSAEQRVTDDVCSSMIEKNSEFYFCFCLNRLSFIDKKLEAHKFLSYVLYPTADFACLSLYHV